MAQRLRPQAETLSGSPQPNFTGYATKPIIAKRNPTASDTGYSLGQDWVNKVNGNSFQLTQVSSGSANWVNTGVDPSGNVDTLTGNTGGAISPAAGNINILGGDTVTVSGSGSTLTINASVAGYPISPYIVGPAGEAGYQTIQSAINAANSAGGGTVYIQPGTYTENLTFYTDIQLVASVGIVDVSPGVTIIGVHTPPISGSMSIRGCILQSTTHTFSSIAAGSATVSLFEVSLNNTNGYTFNLPNWVGSLKINDAGDIGTNNGFVNNTAGASIFTNNCQIGAGTTNPFIANGNVRLDLTFVVCPINISSGLTLGLLTVFGNTLTVSGDATVALFLGDFLDLINNTPAIITTSSNEVILNQVSIASSATNVIQGTGTVNFTQVGFSENSAIAGTITVASSSIFASGEIRSGADIGGSTGFTSLTKTNSTTISTGVGSVRMSSGNAATNTAWIKIYIGTVAYWIPAWTTNSP